VNIQSVEVEYIDSGAYQGGEEDSFRVNHAYTKEPLYVISSTEMKRYKALARFAKNVCSQYPKSSELFASAESALKKTKAGKKEVAQ
jgi:hypothetical protein